EIPAWEDEKQFKQLFQDWQIQEQQGKTLFFALKNWNPLPPQNANTKALQERIKKFGNQQDQGVEHLQTLMKNSLKNTPAWEEFQNKYQHLKKQKQECLSLLNADTISSSSKDSLILIFEGILRLVEEEKTLLEQLQPLFFFDLFAHEKASFSVPFLPSQHGFRFVNSFEGYPIPSLPFLETILKTYSTGNFHYGLCGGMSTAAYDFYLAQQLIPKETVPPKKGTPLYDYLFQRQSATFGQKAEFIFKFVQWMTLPETTLQIRTFEELKEVVSRLAKGNASVLGLVYIKASESLVLWRNHQVLAYRYDRPNETEILLHIYDPNYPQDNSIYIEVKKTQIDPLHSGVTARQWIRGAFRKTIHGFFVMPYQSQIPDSF
ncbi:MAG: hypothetical protein AABZ60_19445, partial [Planctomycetota bacterium]